MRNVGVYIPGLESDGLTKSGILRESGIFDNFYVLPYKLPLSPAVALIENSLSVNFDDSDSMVYLIGSSLGGLIANHIAAKKNYYEILINPVVDPEDLTPLVGATALSDEDIEEAKQMLGVKDNGKLVLVTKDDELLSYEKTIDKYNDYGNVVVFPDGGHKFNQFERVLPYIREFVGYYV